MRTEVSHLEMTIAIPGGIITLSFIARNYHVSVYLVAPSGYCINQQAAARGVERLQQAGHEVAHQQVIPRRQQRFAGTEHERLADINQLAQLPGRNRIVLAVRGGYGASRLLPHIDWQGLVARQQRDPLLICGHSDFTAIQSGLLAMGNVITFSGPMLAGNFGAETLDPFTEHHSGRRYASRNSPSNGRAKGRTAGWKAPCGGEIWRC